MFPAHISPRLVLDPSSHSSPLRYSHQRPESNLRGVTPSQPSSMPSNIKVPPKTANGGGGDGDDHLAINPDDISPRSWRDTGQFSPSWKGPDSDTCPYGNLPCKHGMRSHYLTENPGERTCYGCRVLWGETVVCRPPDSPVPNANGSNGRPQQSPRGDSFSSSSGKSGSATNGNVNGTRQTPSVSRNL